MSRTTDAGVAWPAVPRTRGGSPAGSRRSSGCARGRSSSDSRIRTPGQKPSGIGQWQVKMMPFSPTRTVPTGLGHRTPLRLRCPFRATHHRRHSTPAGEGAARARARPRALVACHRACMRAVAGRLDPSDRYVPFSRPHITLAGRLTPDRADAVWPVLRRRRFVGRFVCRELLLWRMRAGEARWRLVCRLPLTGPGARRAGRPSGPGR